MSRDASYLLDILLACRRILGFVAGREVPEFEQDEMLQSAVVRQFEIIGEAARRVSPEFRALHPEFPWNEMIGMRNRLVHEYSAVNLEQVWTSTRKDVPELIRLLDTLLPEEGASGTGRA